MDKYISLPFNYEPKALLEVLDPIAKSVIPCHTKTVIQIYKMLGITVPIHSILYFKLLPTEASIIHIDKNLANKNNDAEFALNLPLLNSDKVIMRWYSDNNPITDYEIFIGPNGTNTPSLPKDRVTCIDQLYYTSPHIVRINDWHSVENESTTNIAHFISLRFFSSLKTVMEKTWSGVQESNLY